MWDAHADTIGRIMKLGESLYQNTGHFDLHRAENAGITGQILSLYTSENEPLQAFDAVLKQIDYYSDQLTLCEGKGLTILRREDVSRHHNGVRFWLHLEGGTALGTEIHRLRVLHKLGVRSVGLTWNHRNDLAEGIMDQDSDGGLTRFGRAVVAEMNALRMMVDLAHIAKKGFYDVLNVSQAPPIVSHTGARAVYDHPRNLSDEQLKHLEECGGLAAIYFVPGFLAVDHAGIEHLLDHICHIADLIGVRHVALGSDFDGTDLTVIPDVSCYPLMREGLTRRGFTAEEVEHITGTNLKRFIEKQLL